MLKILGRRTSGNTQKVLWCCDELGIAYEREDVGRRFGKNHEILDAQLAKQPFVAGDNLTMADIPSCYIVNRWYRLPIERRGLTNVKAWYDRLCERPAFRRNVYEVG